jgi:DNA-binding NarL/FixJ family response regulator
MAIHKSRSQGAPLKAFVPRASSEEQIGARRSRIAWRRLASPAPVEERNLTVREREVLGCFAEGLGTEAIALRLSISRTTVRNHAQRILTKLAVHTRLAAVVFAFQNKLI